MTKWISLFSGVVLASITFSPSAAADYEWRYYGGLPLTHEYSKRIVQATEAIKERTGGRLEITYVFYGETPYKMSDALTVLRDGLAEITEWPPSYSSGTYPILVGPELPFVIPKASAAKGQEAADVAWSTPTVASAFDKIVADHGGAALARYYFQPMNFWFASSVEGFDDLSGKTIRVFTPEQAVLVTALKSDPVNISTTEVYTALQRNVMNGLITGSGNLKGSNWGEVLHGGYIVNMTQLASTVLVNKAKLDGLPEDIRGVLIEEMKNLQEEIRSFMPESDTTAKAEAAKDPTEFTIVEATADDYARLREIAANQVWPSWVERAGPNAEKALDEIQDALDDGR